jgi:RNA processing factor Prp31
MYSSDTKKAARQIVRESMPQILAGTFQIPSLEEMVSILQTNFEYSFDEYKAKQRIARSHMGWSNSQVLDELDRQRRRYENELRVNLKVTALSTIEEIENLIKSLKHRITDWKVKNL